MTHHCWSGKYGFLVMEEFPLEDNPLIIYNYAFNLQHEDIKIYDAASDAFPERVCGVSNNSFTFTTPYLYFFTDELLERVHRFNTYLHPNIQFGGIGFGTTFYARFATIQGTWSWQPGATLYFNASMDIIDNHLTFNSLVGHHDCDPICASTFCDRHVDERFTSEDEDGEFRQLGYLEFASFTITSNNPKIRDAYSAYNGSAINIGGYGLVDVVITLRFQAVKYDNKSGLPDSLVNRYMDNSFISFTDRDLNTFSYRFYTDDVNYWEFNNFIPLRVYDIEVNRTTGMIIGMTVELGITAVSYGSSVASATNISSLSAIEWPIFLEAPIDPFP